MSLFILRSARVVFEKKNKKNPNMMIQASLDLTQ